MRAWLRDFRMGLSIVCSRSFWRDFGEYWSGPAIAARIVEHTRRLSADDEHEARDDPEHDQHGH